MDKHKIKPSGFDVFRQNLQEIGFQSYESYLCSDTWAAFKNWYSETHWCPQSCVVCGNKIFELHHWTYMRVGREDLQDVIPLCGDHHKEIHSFISVRRIKLDDIKRQFRECFGFSDRDVRNRLSHCFKKRKQVKHRQQKAVAKTGLRQSAGTPVETVVCNRCKQRRDRSHFRNMLDLGYCKKCNPEQRKGTPARLERKGIRDRFPL